MPDWLNILLLTLMAGLAMPLGGICALYENFRHQWLKQELRHTVIAFGGGALLSAVALVLVPEGIANLPMIPVLICLAAGGVVFMAIDIYLAKLKSSSSQLVAMLTDFIPESLALGATLASGSASGLLLAGLMAIQNLPEGFNAFKEIEVNYKSNQWKIIAAFTSMTFLGPIAGLAGLYFLADYEQVVSGIMLFAAGGILYLVFQDIAPQAKLRKHWAPPIGAVAGFSLGVAGKMLIA